jgi:hypothetical protein
MQHFNNCNSRGCGGPRGLQSHGRKYMGGSIDMSALERVIDFGKKAAGVATTVNEIHKSIQEFPGERHGIILTSRGPKTAQYMGPGTNLKTRLQRGDPGLSETDRISKAHDIRYGLNSDPQSQHIADTIMINALKKSKDNVFNKGQAYAGIKAKMALEKRGIPPPGVFAKSGGISAEDRPMAMAELNKLEQMGYGAVERIYGHGLRVAGGKLRAKMLKKYGTKKKGSGPVRVITLEQLEKNPKLSQYKGMGLRLAGGPKSGGKLPLKELAKLAAGTLAPHALRYLKNKIGVHGITPAALRSVRDDILNLNPKDISKLAIGVAKAMLGAVPELMKMKGSGRHIARTMNSFLKKASKGQRGAGFFDDFMTGFKMPFEFAGKALDTVGIKPIDLVKLAI